MLNKNKQYFRKVNNNYYDYITATNTLENMLIYKHKVEMIQLIKYFFKHQL